MKNKPISYKDFIQSEINFLNESEGGYEQVIKLSDGKHSFEELYSLINSPRVRKTKNNRMFPKSINKNQSGYYAVTIYSKKYKKKIHVATFKSLEEAIKARDKFIIENYNDVTEGYLPRGIAKVRKGFRASFNYMNTFCYIGQYDTLQEAVEKRNEFIDSLK